MEWLKEYWALIWAAVLTLSQIANMLLTKTFARKEDLEKVRRDVDELQAKIDQLPTDEEVNRLRLELSEMRGELKELRAELKPINHLSQLLLEQRLNDDK
ncbi:MULTISPECIES: DUF2730 family protein [unclassified Vibrio]|uniref:DUF2730 family protein n=1 Tax=unclassified Vibrio TaxID=2614977 RepID=UPI0004DD712E|nr:MULTISPECIES: DUF2730 family protein [unclassified Vibrio]KFA96236.1 hypothetical protein HW45_19935 [Vibrio sp. ER1A]MCF4173545.1 DUF2730 domain-containing protein [Vibrio sp. McD22-P3]